MTVDGVAFRPGTDEVALRWAEQVLRDHPGQPEVCRLLADYHERHGDGALANYYRLSARSE